MHIELEGITPPDDDATLWRYMSFEKFANILATKSLFFTRADKFEDPLEGYIPPSIKDIHKQSIYKVLKSEDNTEKVIKSLENWRKYVMCNCWYHNEEESMAMWEKYRIHNSGIAIKTTMEALRNSLTDGVDVFIGNVDYSPSNTYVVNYLIKFASDTTSSHTKMIYFPYFLKRKAFEYEHEVRVVIDAEPFVKDYFDRHGGDVDLATISNNEFPDICDIGMLFNVDVETLIGKTGQIIISPYADEWVTQTVESVVCKYGFKFPVNRSKMLEPAN